VSRADQEHWDTRYKAEAVGDIGPPALFAPVAAELANCGSAIELACGTGETSLWLASQGVDVAGYDISPVAITIAQSSADEHDLQCRCRFEVTDFDDGLPDGPAVDLVLCHMFRDASLDDQLRRRLAPNGLLAIACLSEVGAGPGRFRAARGELRSAFSDLALIIEGERDGVAWLVARYG